MTGSEDLSYYPTEWINRHRRHLQTVLNRESILLIAINTMQIENKTKLISAAHRFLSFGNANRRRGKLLVRTLGDNETCCDDRDLITYYYKHGQNDERNHIWILHRSDYQTALV